MRLWISTHRTLVVVGRANTLAAFLEANGVTGADINACIDQAGEVDDAELGHEPGETKLSDNIMDAAWRDANQAWGTHKERLAAYTFITGAPLRATAAWVTRACLCPRVSNVQGTFPLCPDVMGNIYCPCIPCRKPHISVHREQVGYVTLPKENMCARAGRLGRSILLLSVLSSRS